jgi:hypothetical protein
LSICRLTVSGEEHSRQKTSHLFRRPIPLAAADMSGEEKRTLSQIPLKLRGRHGSGESKNNILKILYFSSLKLDPFAFKHFYFFPYGGSRRPPPEAPDPTGCGKNPVSGNLRRIGISFHCLSHPPIGFRAQGMGNLFIGRYAPFGHLP